MVIDREDLAWAAGFYEGEGTICASYSKYTDKRGERKQRKTPQLSLVIGQTDIEPLIKFFCATGEIGSIYGPYEVRNNWKSQYQFNVRSFEYIQAIIAMLWPWLSKRRKEQAITVLTAERR